MMSDMCHMLPDVRCHMVSGRCKLGRQRIWSGSCQMMLGQKKNHAASWDNKRSCNLLRQKKITQPLGTKKIMQPLGTKKNHATS